MTSGTRSHPAISAARYRFEFAAWLIVPAFTVKSSAATITGRPSIWPDPITTASAGASSPPTSVPSSWNDPGSRRWPMRARASSFPASRCLRSRSSPPMAREACRRLSRSPRTSSHPSELPGSTMEPPRLLASAARGPAFRLVEHLQGYQGEEVLSYLVPPTVTNLQFGEGEFRFVRVRGRARHQARLRAARRPLRGTRAVTSLPPIAHPRTDEAGEAGGTNRPAPSASRLAFTITKVPLNTL